MYFYHNIDNELTMNVEHVRSRQQLIQTVKQRFLTYGYEEITTSTFEDYDLYASMNGTVNHHEMIKTIDNTGKVLVLRPDITIPLTQKIAMHYEDTNEPLRYFYVLDVFRQAVDSKDFLESTQAGVEYFGNDAPEADAEIIALAIHVLKDFQLANFKIELGHAGFFKQLVAQLELNQENLHELIEYIQAKNVPEIEQFITKLNIDENVGKIVSSLPFLYGNPIEVIEKVKKLPLDASMKETLQNLEQIYEILQAYGVAQHVVMDLSLINHMDYYSDLIFQGFIENVGKPVLMGGRYDKLANEFDANIPAIGFAYDIDALMLGMNHKKHRSLEKTAIDVGLFFDKTVEQKGLQLATKLRENNYTVITNTFDTVVTRPATFTITIEIDKNTVNYKQNSEQFSNEEELFNLLERFKERE